MYYVEVITSAGIKKGINIFGNLNDWGAHPKMYTLFKDKTDAEQVIILVSRDDGFEKISLVQVWYWFPFLVVSNKWMCYEYA